MCLPVYSLCGDLLTSTVVDRVVTLDYTHGERRGPIFKLCLKLLGRFKGGGRELGIYSELVYV